MSAPRRVMVVTGTRAEYGLLRSTIDAIEAHDGLEALVVVAGSHFLGPAETWREVAREREIAARVEMQRDGETGRLADGAALGRGVGGFAAAVAELRPDWALVLGDRIEAFAAAAAASVAGVGVAHVHGGDRAEGVADEAMRHAITKLAHLHLCATEASAERVRRMGEDAGAVRAVGSPAIDGLDAVAPMADARVADLFGAGARPRFVLLLHPAGLGDEAEAEAAYADAAIGACAECVGNGLVVCLAPNHDPGRDAVLARTRDACARDGRFRLVEHLERGDFLALLARLGSYPGAGEGGALVGNSSAGLIEAAALGVRCLNVGPRQRGREAPATVLTVAEDPCEAPDAGAVRDGLSRLLGGALDGLGRDHHPYGDGRAGERIAAALAGDDPGAPGRLRKRNAY